MLSKFCGITEFYLEYIKFLKNSHCYIVGEHKAHSKKPGGENEREKRVGRNLLSNK